MIENRYEYDIFGNPTLTIELYANEIRYAGEFFDAGTGLYDLRARYYDPYTGRFITEDSYRGQDNDPIMYVDPSGHTVIKQGDSSDAVKAIQEYLTNAGYELGKADGVFGAKTKAAVIQFQKDNKLQVDGIVGNQTLTVLKTVNTVEHAPDYVKAAAISDASKAKSGGISDQAILMSSQKFEKTLNEVSQTQKATGGVVQTKVTNNQVVVTGVKLPEKKPESSSVSQQKSGYSQVARVETTPSGSVSEALTQSIERIKSQATNSAVSFVKGGVDAVVQTGQGLAGIGEVLISADLERYQNELPSFVTGNQEKARQEAEALVYEFQSQVMNGNLESISHYAGGLMLPMLVTRGVGKVPLPKASVPAVPAKPHFLDKPTAGDSKGSMLRGEGAGNVKFSPNNLPKDPQELIKNGWKDVTPEGMAKNTTSREFIDPETGLKVRFDPGKPGANGFEGKDHYHVYNPDGTTKADYYLDANGNPVAKGSKASHIEP